MYQCKGERFIQYNDAQEHFLFEALYYECMKLSTKEEILKIYMERETLTLGEVEFLEKLFNVEGLPVEVYSKLKQDTSISQLYKKQKHRRFLQHVK